MNPDDQIEYEKCISNLLSEGFLIEEFVDGISVYTPTYAYVEDSLQKKEEEYTLFWNSLHEEDEGYSALSNIATMVRSYCSKIRKEITKEYKNGHLRTDPVTNPVVTATFKLVLSLLATYYDMAVYYGYLTDATAP